MPAKQINKKIVALEYIDASFFYKKPRIWPGLIKHTVLGKVIHLTEDAVVIEFTKKNNTSERGVLIPLNAIVTSNKTNKINKKTENPLLENGLIIGVTWRDIVYFDNGNIPKKPTEIYSEGILIYKNDKYIVLRNTGTIAISKKDIKEFPNAQKKPTYFVIPISFISNIEKYERK